MVTILWIIALLVGLYGAWRLIKGDFLWGVVFIVVALLIGPGGCSVFS